MTNVQTITEARDNTSNDKLSIAERRSLKDRANDHDNAADSDGLPATETITNPKVREGTKETSDFLYDCQIRLIFGVTSDARR